jgi:DNA-binding MarR family transcriptional regulator
MTEDARLVKHLTNPLSGRELPLGNLLGAAARQLGSELDDALGRAELAGVRSAHAAVFQFIEPGGSRLNDLADRAGMTKQALGELVRHLEEHGYVTVAPDPDDRRAKRVTLTGAGWHVVDVGVQVIDDYDDRLRKLIGPGTVRELRRQLELIRNGIDTETDD